MLSRRILSLFSFRTVFLHGLARFQLYYLPQARIPALLAAGLRRRPLAAKRRIPIRDKDLKGLKYFKVLAPFLDGLHQDATARDRAGNRRLFYDQYACLILLYFFNPIINSLR